MKFTGKRKITTAVAAATVGALALPGGTHAGFVTQDTSAAAGVEAW